MGAFPARGRKPGFAGLIKGRGTGPEKLRSNFDVLLCQSAPQSLALFVHGGLFCQSEALPRYREQSNPDLSGFVPARNCI
jgi:hypothetical protein